MKTVIYEIANVCAGLTAIGSIFVICIVLGG
jgi:hypothetical protein